MNPVLEDLIRRFRSAQDRGAAFVADVLGPTFGVRRPVSNREWIADCRGTGLTARRRFLLDGVEVYAHGFGIELKFDGLTIDFDWGDRGEPDGFDAWRLWYFIQANHLVVDCGSLSQVRSWLEEAFALGELTSDLLLYYSPDHRAGIAEAEREPAGPNSQAIPYCEASPPPECERAARVSRRRPVG